MCTEECKHNYFYFTPGQDSIGLYYSQTRTCLECGQREEKRGVTNPKWMVI